MNLQQYTGRLDSMMNVCQSISIIYSLNLITLLCISLGVRRYTVGLWKAFTDCFNCLPFSAVWPRLLI